MEPFEQTADETDPLIPNATESTRTEAPDGLCTAVHEDTRACCHLAAGHDGPTHQGWAHYPGQLAVWPNP